ncbi:TetR/AcrR family transcriptional regulator [Radiobacillus deserti]|uniref:TetR family transcriptional regulator n=1 Tax=Radiobacillus deserti TaxID=2594883 RepID=A0A516KJD8_9BACI|nr:TetR family transcriptional regulator [Radiobacillus deserti]QDP41491.1 TetR family transcriptional regulator [Radiobacillus deserti]
MRPIDRIMDALKKLSLDQPYDKITYADVAKEAGVHWTTVRRHFGSKEHMKKILLDNQGAKNLSYTDTRTKILESAERTFAMYGYEGTSLDKVAENAGLTKGAVYWHFSSKSDLFLTLTERSLKELIKELPHQSKEVFDSVSPVEALKVLFENEFRACAEDKNEKTLLFFEFISKRRDKEIKDKLNASFSQLFLESSEILKELQQQNRVTSNIDPNALSVVLHALMNGIILMYLVSPDSVPLNTIANDVSKVVWKGIAPKN